MTEQTTIPRRNRVIIEVACGVAMIDTFRHDETRSGNRHCYVKLSLISSKNLAMINRFISCNGAQTVRMTISGMLYMSTLVADSPMFDALEEYVDKRSAHFAATPDSEVFP